MLSPLAFATSLTRSRITVLLSLSHGMGVDLVGVILLSMPYSG